MNDQEPSNANSPSVGSLVPPRPNLGPEAWPEARNSARWFLPCVALAVLILAFGFWNRRKRRSRLSDRSASSDQPGDRVPSERERLITASDRVRQALLDAFGPAWRSKTTEEIGRDPQIVDWLDSSDFDRLMSFLNLADRAKFAEDDPPSLPDWEESADTILKRLDDRLDPKSVPAVK